MKDINPEELEDFYLPESLLKEIYNLTGEFDGNSGFILACVGQEGKPFIYSKFSNEIIELGIRKALEEYLMKMSDYNSLDFLDND